MRTRIAWLLIVVAAACSWAGGAAGGTVYLPLAIDGALDGKTYGTYVWVTNPGGSGAQVEARFIRQDQAGAAGAATVTASLTVGAGQTFRLRVGETGVGMVALTGPDDALYSARLESYTPGGVVRSQAHLPLIDRDSLFPAGAVAHVQGAERAVAGSASHLGVATFGAADGRCEIAAFRADSRQLASTATILGPALGQRWFPDVLSLLGEPSIRDARFRVTCDVPFFPFLAILGETPDSTQFVLPAIVGDGPTDTPPPPPPPPPPTPGQLLRLDGTFFTVSRGDSLFDVELPIAAGVRFRRLEWEFDLFLPTLVDATGPNAANFHSTTLLLRPVAGGTHFFHSIRGNGRYKSIVDTGAGEPGIVRGANDGWEPEALHRVRVSYDVEAREVVWELRRRGQIVERLVGRHGVRDLTHGGEGLHILFGLDREYDKGAYLPPYGARFSNLVVRGEPAP